MIFVLLLDNNLVKNFHQKTNANKRERQRERERERERERRERERERERERTGARRWRDRMQLDKIYISQCLSLLVSL